MEKPLEVTFVPQLKADGTRVTATWEHSGSICQKQGMRLATAFEAAKYLKQIGVVELSFDDQDGFNPVIVDQELGLYIFTPHLHEEPYRGTCTPAHYQFYVRKIVQAGSNAPSESDQDLLSPYSKGPSDFPDFYTSGWVFSSSLADYYKSKKGFHEPYYGSGQLAWTASVLGEFFPVGAANNTSRSVVCVKDKSPQN